MFLKHMILKMKRIKTLKTPNQIIPKEKGLIFQSASSCLALKHEQLRSPVTHRRTEEWCL